MESENVANNSLSGNPYVAPFNEHNSSNNFCKSNNQHRGRPSRRRRNFYPRYFQSSGMRQSYNNPVRVNYSFTNSVSETEPADNSHSRFNDVSAVENSFLANNFSGAVPKQFHKRNGRQSYNNILPTENGSSFSDASGAQNLHKSGGRNSSHLNRNLRKNFSGRGQKTKQYARMTDGSRTFNTYEQQNPILTVDANTVQSVSFQNLYEDCNGLKMSLNYSDSLSSTYQDNFLWKMERDEATKMGKKFNKRFVTPERISNFKTVPRRQNSVSLKSCEKDSRKKSSASTERHQKVKDEAISQRDSLIEQITKNAYECMVCCDRVRTKDPIWNCQSCYHIFHLRCIRKWAQSSTAVVEGTGWRCPACQHITEKIPNRYFCFCGKMQDPSFNYYETPHSCGDVCGKQRSNKNCIHRCNILCHPGPCPPCQVQIKKNCECGKTSQLVLCDHASSILCDNICEKQLSCGVHFCLKKCHKGLCDPCQEVITLKCYCGKEVKEVSCTENTAGQLNFSCGLVCDKLLTCGNHNCTSVCHAGNCDGCKFAPDSVTTCPCGQTLLNELLEKPRTSCVDAIPCCGKKCNKLLSCGPSDDPHRCQEFCHPDDCPSCSLKMLKKCDCGFESQEILCVNFLIPIKCTKRCNKKLHCGRHKCLKKCCIDESHVCEQICKRKLSCGLHFCEEQCHRGNCPSCWHTSFDELSCHCGNTVLYPPIPCGTKPPECNNVCARVHSCDHPVMHQCHHEEKCPPCTFLTEKWCYGHHELRSNVPCYLNDISCGLPCGKLLPCGKHHCQQTCHPGECFSPNEKCKQPCTIPRAGCGHPCNAACHPDEPCPVSPCKTKVKVTCHCGHLVDYISCMENLQVIQHHMLTAVAEKLSDINAGQTVDIGSLYKPTNVKSKRLDCNSECALIDRNRRLALALQIRNPELTNKLGPPSYTDFLKDHMKQNPQLVTSIFNKLTELVQNAKQSKQKSRSHAFAPMNREQRRIVHELAEFFGCETCSYDEEPKKNVVATAFRDKSWLPSVSLMTVVERESLPRKAPPPIPHHKSQIPIPRVESVQHTQNGAAKAMDPVQSKDTKVIDYFD